ncbi:MAG: DUF2505 domain-containing protein [Nocardia sp.]|nr:DUF2505 domain-containing protein [Nocardia sp.]
MATPLAYTARYAHPIAALRTAIADEQYWKDRIEEVGGPGARLDSFRADADQVVVAMTQAIPASELPAAITSVRPGDLIIPRTETYRLGDLSGVFEAHVQDAPAQATGTITYTDEGAGCQGVADGSVAVQIPLFGKKIEAVVAQKLLELLTSETEFTDTWITNH